jgi:hypothetical protein
MKICPPITSYQNNRNVTVRASIAKYFYGKQSRLARLFCIVRVIVMEENFRRLVPSKDREEVCDDPLDNCVGLGGASAPVGISESRHANRCPWLAGNGLLNLFGVDLIAIPKNEVEFNCIKMRTVHKLRMDVNGLEDLEPSEAPTPLPPLFNLCWEKGVQNDL